MPIAHFGPAQADVYIPAVVALTIGAAVVGLLLVALPRLRGGAGLAAKVGAGVLVAAAAVAAVALFVPAQRSLDAQVPALQQRIAARYGLHLPDAVVSRLLDGSTVDGATVARYSALRQAVKLEADGSGGYDLVADPAAATTQATPLPTTGS